MDITVIWGYFWHVLLNILVAINSVVHNPGVSIIVFTILMRLLIVPVNLRSLKSSRNMQAIQPLIKEVQKKYPKDRAKQQEETMKIYSQYGINPAASCFPLLLQMPIFFGLYSALSFTLQLVPGAPNSQQHISELGGILWNSDWTTWATFSRDFLWVPNLSQADPLHIWPILAGIFQFVQSRMSMPHRDPSIPVDPQQKMMQNMMQFMPLYIVFISWGFPTGNVVYWAISSIIGAIQQYFITGFGTLPDLPGLNFLPRRIIGPAQLPMPSAAASGLVDGSVPTPRRAGVMNWMMDKAKEAQEAQKTTQDVQPEADISTNPGPAQNGKSQAQAARQNTKQVESLPASDGPTDGHSAKPTGPSALRGGNKGRAASTANGNGSNGGNNGNGKGNGKANIEPREVPTTDMKYQEDLRHRPAAVVEEADGVVAGSNGSTSAPLPRKKKNKR